MTRKPALESASRQCHRHCLLCRRRERHRCGPERLKNDTSSLFFDREDRRFIRRSVFVLELADLRGSLRKSDLELNQIPSSHRHTSRLAQRTTNLLAGVASEFPISRHTNPQKILKKEIETEKERFSPPLFLLTVQVLPREEHRHSSDVLSRLYAFLPLGRFGLTRGQPHGRSIFCERSAWNPMAS